MTGSKRNLLRETEVAERLGVAVHTLQKWRFFGRGPAYHKLGRAVRYSPDAVESWLTARPQGGEPEGVTK